MTVTFPLGQLTDTEAAVYASITRGRDELVTLLADLVGYDTRAPGPDWAPRQEAELQVYVSARMRAAGLAVQLWEPNVDTLDFERYPRPEGYGFVGRPQLLARACGVGEGRTLVLNGHVDVVSADPVAAWASDPFSARVQDGLLFGRGACDMKGGVASMIFAVETLRSLEIPLLGDVLVNTVTDEEITGGGTLASIARGAHGDGAVIPEPTDLSVWLGTRGSLLCSVRVEGRAGHAGFPHDHWSHGGPVNAIEKAGLVLEALRRLGEEWSLRPDVQHHLLFPSALVPTAISSGQWMVSHPADCTIELHVQYTPGHADARGFASRVEAELEAVIAHAAAADPWLREHPPELTVHGDSPPSFHSAEEPVVASLLSAIEAGEMPRELAGRTTFFDGPLFSRAGTPAVAFGPGHIRHAHGVDEHVPVDDVVRCAQVLAITAMRFCGVAGDE